MVDGSKSILCVLLLLPALFLHPPLFGETRDRIIVCSWKVDVTALPMSFQTLCFQQKCFNVLMPLQSWKMLNNSSEKNIVATSCHLFRAEHRYLQDRMSIVIRSDFFFLFLVHLSEEVLRGCWCYKDFKVINLPRRTVIFFFLNDFEGVTESWTPYYYCKMREKPSFLKACWAVHLLLSFPAQRVIFLYLAAIEWNLLQFWKLAFLFFG